MAAAAAQSIAQSFMVLDQKFRPHDFHGDDKDWPGFTFVLKGFCAVVSQPLRLAMDAAALRAEVIGHMEAEGPEKLNNELYYLLVMLCKGRAQEEIMGAEEGCGLEAWRLLNAKYESHAQGRKYGLVNACLNPRIDAADVLASLNTWERNVAQYNAIGDQLSDDIKIAAIATGGACRHGQHHYHLLAVESGD